MGIEFEDASGTPRPTRDVENAARWLDWMLVHQPALMTPEGPAAIHCMTLRDAVRELLQRRARDGG